MSREAGVSSGSEPSQSLSEALKPTKATLLGVWMSAADVHRELESSVQQLRLQSDNPTLKAMETTLERLDSLIFESVEKMDDFFTLISADLESRTAATDAAGNKATGTALVDELDAYLDGAFDRLERPARLSTGTQTETEAPNVATRSPPNVWKVRKDAPSIEVFDLLGKKLRAQNARPKLHIKTEFGSDPSANTGKIRATKPYTTKTKRRLPSPSFSSASRMESDSEMEEEKDATKKEVKRRRHSNSAIKGRHPREIRGFRNENGVTEYAIKYQGVEHLTWVTMDTATKAVKRMIAVYNQARKKQVQDTVSSALHSPDNDAEGLASDHATGVSERNEPEETYNVDKIVGHRMRNGKKEYWVQWEGYGSDENTWEPASKLRREVSDVVEEYERELTRRTSRKRAKTRELMRTKSAMQAKVDELSGRLTQMPAKRLDVTFGHESDSIPSTEEEDEDDSDGDGDDDVGDGSPSGQESFSSAEDDFEMNDRFARAL